MDFKNFKIKLKQDIMDDVFFEPTPDMEASIQEIVDNSLLSLTTGELVELMLDAEEEWFFSNEYSGRSIGDIIFTVLRESLYEEMYKEIV